MDQDKIDFAIEMNRERFHEWGELCLEGAIKKFEQQTSMVKIGFNIKSERLVTDCLSFMDYLLKKYDLGEEQQNIYDRLEAKYDVL